MDAVLYVPFYSPINLLADYFSSQIIRSIYHHTSDLQQEPPTVKYQIVVRKNQEQPLTFSRDIVEVYYPTNLSGCSLRLDQVATSSGDKGLELSYCRTKLTFAISPKFVLPVPQVKEPRLEKRAKKRKKKTVVINII